MSTAAQISELPVPSFSKKKNAEEWGYRPDSASLFEKSTDWAQKHDVKASAVDKFNLHLLLIDVQKDFCFPDGTLYVGGRSGSGAVEDSTRIAQWIYKNLGNITNITCTLDTHFPFQIFSPSFWRDADGNTPPAHTIISSQDVADGKFQPNPAIAKWICNGNYTWLLEYCKHYARELEKSGKYALYLWPYHCLLGTEGHGLVGVVEEARLFHSFCRASKGSLEIKGGNILTENYSVLSPEVLLRHDGQPVAQKNTQFIKTLLDSDAVVIAGQAASHCVKSTIEDLLGEIRAQR